MGEVIILNNTTTLGIPVERVLRGALEQELEEVLVLGWKNGTELYVATSMETKESGLGRLLLLIELSKSYIIKHIEAGIK